MKKNKDLSFTMSFDESPKKVFTAITNVRGWWSERLKGKTDKLGASFSYSYKNLHDSSQKITEFVPNKKIVWHVYDSSLNFINDKEEWNGTDIVFEISKKDGKTKLRFTHIGLTPEVECYDACHGGWGFFIKKSLKSLIVAGKGKPNLFDEEP